LLSGSHRWKEMICDTAFSGRIRLAIGRHALANAGTDDGLHGRG